MTSLVFVGTATYISLFSDGYFHYREFNYSNPATICGLFCLIGIIAGITGIFVRDINKICTLCVLLCILFFFVPNGSSPERAYRISCASDLKQIYLALQQYAMDYADYYPPPNGAAGLEVLRKKDYLTDYAVYHCPGVATGCRCRENPTLTDESIDYVYIGGLNTKSDPNLPIVYDKAENHGSYFGNVLFVDGTIKGIEGNPWTKNIRK